MKQIIQIQAIWFNFKIDGMALYCSKHSLNMLNRSYHQYPLSNKKTAAVTVLHYIKIVIKINRRLNAKAYQLSTCLSWNSQNHIYPVHQSEALNLDLVLLKYLSYLQAWKNSNISELSFYVTEVTYYKATIINCLTMWELTNQTNESKQFWPMHLYWELLLVHLNFSQYFHHVLP